MHACVIERAYAHAWPLLSRARDRQQFSIATAFTTHTAEIHLLVQHILMSTPHCVYITLNTSCQGEFVSSTSIRLLLDDIVRGRRAIMHQVDDDFNALEEEMMDVRSFILETLALDILFNFDELCCLNRARYLPPAATSFIFSALNAVVRSHVNWW